MRTTPDWPVRDLLTHRVAVTPSATAVVDAADGRTWTYRDLDRLVDGVAGTIRDGLSTTPLNPEAPLDRPTVAIPATTDVDFVVALFGTWRAGAVPVPLDASGPPATLIDRLDRVQARLMVTDEDYPWDEASDGRPTVTVDLGDESPPAREADGWDIHAERWQPTDPALVLFTSGTTGEPQGVTLSHRNLVASATGSAARLGLAVDERWLDCLPTNHMGGLAPIVRSTCYGTTVVCQRGFDREATAGAMAEHDATVVSLVPTQLRRLLTEGWEPPDSLRAVLLGGAPASPDLLADAAAAGVPVCPTYGTTETASQVATRRPGQEGAARDAVGPPLVVADVTIVDVETGTPVDAGDVGELVVDGPIVSPGYLDEAATADAFGEFGLHTGDLASRDADGTLRIRGRLDDAIQTGGETVHPARVVEVLEGQSGVAAAAVVGLGDREWGERVAALVVPQAEASLDQASLRAACAADLADYEVPKAVRVVEALPRTDSGTVDRQRVRALLTDDGA